jgi:hypothetical protein
MRNLLLSKGDLCYVFGLVNMRGDRRYYSRLRKYVFTDNALKEIGISEERYNQIKGKATFTALESQRIIQKFQLTPEEL